MNNNSNQTQSLFNGNRISSGINYKKTHQENPAHLKQQKSYTRNYNTLINDNSNLLYQKLERNITKQTDPVNLAKSNFQTSQSSERPGISERLNSKEFRMYTELPNNQDFGSYILNEESTLDFIKKYYHDEQEILGSENNSQEKIMEDRPGKISNSKILALQEKRNKHFFNHHNNQKVRENIEQRKKFHEINYNNHLYHKDNWNKPNGFNINGVVEVKPCKLQSQHLFKTERPLLKPAHSSGFLLLPKTSNSEFKHAVPKGSLNINVMKKTYKVMTNLAKRKNSENVLLKRPTTAHHTNALKMKKSGTEANLNFTDRASKSKTCLNEKQKPVSINYMNRFDTKTSINSDLQQKNVFDRRNQLIKDFYLTNNFDDKNTNPNKSKENISQNNQDSQNDNNFRNFINQTHKAKILTKGNKFEIIIGKNNNTIQNLHERKPIYARSQNITPRTNCFDSEISEQRKIFDFNEPSAYHKLHISKNKDHESKISSEKMIATLRDQDSEKNISIRNCDNKSKAEAVAETILDTMLVQNNEKICQRKMSDFSNNLHPSKGHRISLQYSPNIHRDLEAKDSQKSLNTFHFKEKTNEKSPNIENRGARSHSMTIMNDLQSDLNNIKTKIEKDKQIKEISHKIKLEKVEGGNDSKSEHEIEQSNQDLKDLTKRVNHFSGNQHLKPQIHSKSSKETRKSINNIKLQKDFAKVVVEKYGNSKIDLEKVRYDQAFFELFKNQRFCWANYEVCLKKNNLNPNFTKSNYDITIHPIIVEKITFGNKLGSIFGLCVGHGLHRFTLVKMVHRTLLSYIDKYFRKKKEFAINEIIFSLKNMILHARTSILKKSYLESFKSGVSVCLCQVIDNKVITCNIGGSMAILVREKQDVTSCIAAGLTNAISVNEIHKNRFKFLEICKKHDTFNLEEVERIRGAGGEIRMDRDQYGDNSGGMKIFVKKDATRSYKLTRCIGDFEAQDIGLLNEPEVHVQDLTVNDRYIMIGVNYLWKNVETNMLKKLLDGKIEDKNDKEICKILQQKFFNRQEKGAKGLIKVDHFNEQEDFGLVLVQLNIDKLDKKFYDSNENHTLKFKQRFNDVIDNKKNEKFVLQKKSPQTLSLLTFLNPVK